MLKLRQVLLLLMVPYEGLTVVPNVWMHTSSGYNVKRTYHPILGCCCCCNSKKNMNASKSSEYPPSKGGKLSKLIGRDIEAARPKTLQNI